MLTPVVSMMGVVEEGDGNKDRHNGGNGDDYRMVMMITMSVMVVMMGWR